MSEKSPGPNSEFEFFSGPFLVSEPLLNLVCKLLPLGELDGIFN